MMLESWSHDFNLFVTLTYDDENLPHDGSLVPRDFTLFLDRFRKRILPRRVRYFMCGEYGDQTWRPHYHAILFGVGYDDVKLIEESWGMGFIKAGDVNQQTCQYTASYVVKKMTFKDDWRLAGKHPEYARMSRKPGVGAGAAALLAEQLHLGTGWDIVREKDVPKSLKLGRQTILLGRYLRHMLRNEIGMDDDWKEALKQEWVNDVDETMLPLRVAAKASKEKTAKQLLVEKMMGRIWSVEGKAKLKVRGSL